jgi:hypothetical protein
MRATCLTHFTLLDLISLIISGEEYKLWNSTLCSLLQLPRTSSLLGPNILFSTCSQTPSIYILPLVWENQVQHPFKKDKIVSFLKVTELRWKNKIFWTDWYKALPKFILILNYSWIQFLLPVVLKYMNFTTLCKAL